MASTEVEQPLKTWVLRVSIHCEGCKRKVKKLLQSLPGVHDIDIETKLQRVVVTGDIISPDIIIRKLVKAGKHAQIWPQNPPQRTRQPPTTSQGTTTQQETKSPPTKTEIPVADPSKSTSTKEIPGGGKGDEGVSEGEVAGGDGKKPALVVKVEDKKPETAGSAGNQASQPVVEQKEEQTKKDSSVVSGGDVKRKKKKKAQNSNKDNTGEASSSASPPIIGGSGNEGGGPSNQSPPRHHGYQYPPPPHYYRPPAAPVYTVSYNTAHPPVSSYTASYYAAAAAAAAPAPQSYAYSHFQSEMEPPPPAQSYGYSHYRSEMEPQNVRSDFDSYTQQPLDSFEMFSDENPNGCLVM